MRLYGRDSGKKDTKSLPSVVWTNQIMANTEKARSRISSVLI